MSLWIYFVICIVIFANASNSSLVDYSGYSLYIVKPETKSQLQLLQSIANKKAYNVDFWSNPYKVNKSVNVLVQKVEIHSFSSFLDINKIPYSIEDVDINGYTPNSYGSSRAVIQKFSINVFNTYDNAMQWLEKTANSCKICEFKKIGNTFQNRGIYLIKIGSGKNKGVFIDANIHAREWISGASALQLINILTNSSDPLGQYLTSKLTFHIVPFANPDGYEFSRTSTRFWRKNRRTNAGSTCVGVDPNRNYPVAFGGQGSSRIICSDTYRGPSAFSELETKALSNYITTNKKQLSVYIALHSYGRLILLPWGCNYSKPADYNELLRVGNEMNKQIISSTGFNYDVIPGSDLYPAGGASDDWAKAQGIKYVYTIEMGSDRFDPSNAEISNLSKEFAGAMKGLAVSLP